MKAEANISLKARFFAGLLTLLKKLLSLTYRVESFEGQERWETILKENTPVLLTAWHNRVFYLSIMIKREIVRRGFKLAIMTSLSKDGQIGAAMGMISGARVVRGSPSRGGTEGFRRFYRLMKKEGYSIVILPDGSKGPKYEAKMGVVVMAQLTKCPIIPMSFSADRYWEIPSWDKMIIPKPFARISVVIGDDILVDRDADEQALESSRKSVEQVLMEMNARAKALISKG